MNFSEAEEIHRGLVNKIAADNTRYLEALQRIANEPAVMGPDGHWCQSIAREALKPR